MSLQVKDSFSEKSTECKIQCDYEILRKSEVFLNADPEVVRLFAYLAKRKKYKAGERLITLGKDANMAVYLVSGSAEVTTMYKDREVVLQQIKPGTICGELALLAQFEWFFNLRATEETEAILISRESVQKVFEKFPEKRDTMIEKIVKLRIDRLNDSTTFLLEKLPESLLNEWVWAPSTMSI